MPVFTLFRKKEMQGNSGRHRIQGVHRPARQNSRIIRGENEIKDRWLEKWFLQLLRI